MRIFSIVPSDANSEAGLPPPAGVVEEMARLGAEAAASGLITDQGGLLPSKFGARVELKDGKAYVTDGPFAESKELIAGYAILNVDTIEAAIVQAKRLPLRCELELRPLYDFGAVPAAPRKPGTLRWMLCFKAGTELAGPPTPEMIAEMNAYNQALIDAGALLGAEGLQPSSEAVRVDLATGEVKRGPFDPKNLVTGWWTIQAANKAEAVEWAKRVPIPNGVIEVRPFMDQENCAQNVHDLAAAAS
jgi:hypothetical protein